MCKVQISTPGGEELVVLPRAEYELLVAGARASSQAEDEPAEYVAIFDQRTAEFAENKAGLLPKEVSAALLKGATLVRALRDWRGIRQQQLAAKAGLGQGYLSDIERGRSQGSPEARESLAQALDVPKEWLR